MQLRGLAMLAVSMAIASHRALAPTPPAVQPAALPKLQLGPAHCVDVFGAPVSGGGSNGSRALLDEQAAAGDPASGSGGDVKYAYMPGYLGWEYSGGSIPGQGIQGLIDLKATHAVSDIWMNHHNGNAIAVLEIYAESPFGLGAKPVWRQEVNTTQDAVTKKTVAPPPVCTGWGWAQRWCGWNISSTEAAAPKGRYILVSVLAPVSFFEMVVYGKQQGAPPPSPPPTPPPQLPMMGSFIGINSFVTEPLSRQVAAGSIREYHDWQWDEGVGDPCYPHAQTKFSPDWSGFLSDPFYKTRCVWGPLCLLIYIARSIDASACELKSVHVALVHRDKLWPASAKLKGACDDDIVAICRAAAGIKTHVVLQGRPLCQFGTNKTTASWKCVDNSADIGTSKTMDPSSYSQLAAHVYQYVARYGSVKVPDARLALAPGQPRLTGAGWLDAIEVRNEPNGYWAGAEAFMTPVEQAALLSACFDGHEGTVGIEPAVVGARQADPSVLVSMGGLSGATQVALDNVAVMRLWFQANRKDRRFAADVLNFHFYCNDDQTSKGASPEECDLEGVVKNLTRWRDLNEPSLQVWLSEFGYDTSPLSPNLAKAYGVFSAEDVQGMWLIRSYLYMAMARIDRAEMFMLADSHDNGGQKFMTSGLTSAKTSNYEPKKSWYFVSTMLGLLRNTRFAGEVQPGSSGDARDHATGGDGTAGDGAGVRIARFSRDGARAGGGAATVFAVWLGSKAGASRSVTIDVSGFTAAATPDAVLVELSGNSTNGAQSLLSITAAGKVTVVASEMPAFVLLGEGLAPQQPSGPVPPVDPPVAAACADLPIGLHCTGTGTYNGSFIIVSQLLQL
jgi:hypothetical protein